MQSAFSRHAVIMKSACSHHAVISRQWPRGQAVEEDRTGLPRAEDRQRSSVVISGHKRSSAVISGSRPVGSVSCRGSRMNLIAAWRSLMEIVPSPLTSRAWKRTSPDEGAHQLQSACKPRNNQGSLSVWSSSASPSSPAPKSIPNSAIRGHQRSSEVIISLTFLARAQIHPKFGHRPLVRLAINLRRGWGGPLAGRRLHSRVQ